MHPSRLVQVIELIHRRRARRAERGRAVAQRALQIGALLLGTLGLAAALLTVAALPFYNYVTADLPQIQELETLLDPRTGSLLQATSFYDRSGQHILLTLQPVNAERVFIDASDNPFLANAFVAASDPSFWEQSGFRLPSLDEHPRGLPEQLVSRVLLAGEPDGWRKTVRAWLLGAEATGRYSREQILTWEFNSATFGHWTFGAGSAARFYFGKPATGLTLGEAAMLAAVARAPQINPIDAPDLAKQFEGLVLVAMREQGYISQGQLDAALAEQVKGVAPTILMSDAPDFTDLALQQLAAELGSARIQRGGLDVITTLDYPTQQEISRLASGTEVTILDPINGRLIAMLGPATTTSHAPASLFTPFIYLSAFAQGQAPASLAWDFTNPNTTSFPVNSFHGPVSLRAALANDYTVPAAKLIGEIGANDIAAVLRAAGFGAFRSPQPEAQALLQIEGGAQVSAIEAAIAFGTLSNLGIRTGKFSGGELQPSTLLFVSDEHDQILLDWSHPHLEAITSPELPYLVTDVLSDASVRAQTVTLGRPAALQPIAPTTGEGTWAIGYSPQRVVVLWTQAEDEVAASDLWTMLFEAAHRDLPIQSWPVPAGLTSVIVCIPSGQLPDEDCPETRRELFLGGSKPRGPDSLFERAAVNSLNGKLATIFTPNEFVEERLFVNVPPEVEAWAQAAGMPLLPEEYDPLPGLDESGQILILQPAPFSPVNGIVNLSGQVGADAISYDVQVGQGLRPTQWTQIASSNEPLEGNQLTSWDTSGLSGLWVIQLQVWDGNGNLQRAYTIVTIQQ